MDFVEVREVVGEFSLGEVPDFFASGFVKDGGGLGVLRDPGCSAVYGPAAGDRKLDQGKGDENRT